MKRAVMTLVVLAFAGVVQAQQYPGRTVRVIVPWPPGQATDLAARIVADKLSQAGSVVADNRRAPQDRTDGRRAAPDGYTCSRRRAGRSPSCRCCRSRRTTRSRISRRSA
jgi:hypothetical protein